jgi:hypothetical protein
MPDADPKNIRQAVAEFQPHRRPRFQNLLVWNDVIVELRAKGASCEAIAELLTRHGVKTSRTMVNEFLLTLSQSKANRRLKLLLQPVTRPPKPAAVQPPVTPVRRQESSPVESVPEKPRGPHIAKVELLPPGEQYD